MILLTYCNLTTTNGLIHLPQYLIRPSPETMLTYCQSCHLGTNFSVIRIKIRPCILIWLLQNVGHFVQGSMPWLIRCARSRWWHGFFGNGTLQVWQSRCQKNSCCVAKCRKCDRRILRMVQFGMTYYRLHNILFSLFFLLYVYLSMNSYV